MTRPWRIVRNIAAVLAGLVLLAVVAGIPVVRTQWFRNYVRQKIVAAVEDGTGGRVEVGSLALDWMPLRAVVTNVVIHGNEPAGTPPYLSAARVEAHVRLLTNLHHLLDITYLAIDRPHANIEVAADGTSNVPQPKHTSPPSSNTSPLQTIVDLAVGQFQLSNGAVTFNSQEQAIDLRGESLRVQLSYDLLKRSYRGEVSMSPLYVVSGRHTPVKFLITLPVTIDSDAIALHNASIQTDRSQLAIDGTLGNWNNLTASAHVRGHVDLTDLKNFGNMQRALDTRGVPEAIDLELDGAMAGNAIDVKDARIAYGGSSIHASGELQDSSGKGSLLFQVRLALPDLSRLLKLELRPHGMLDASGFAKLDADHLGVDNLRVSALGAEITGSASLQDFARYALNVSVKNLDLRTVTRTLGIKNSPYGGIISGPLTVKGDLKASHRLAANAGLAIAPARNGTPLSGRIAAEYHADNGNLIVHDSFLALPHSRLQLDGSIGSRLNVGFTTSDLADFAPLTGGSLPVTLASAAKFTGAVAGQVTAPQIAGHFSAGRFSTGGRRFNSLAGDISAARSGASLTNASIRRGSMVVQISALVGLSNWNPAQDEPLTVQASIRNADLADALALAGVPPAGYSGTLTADANISGTVGNPRGAATVTVTAGKLHGEPIDQLQAQVKMTDRLVTVPSVEVTAGTANVTLAAEFRHPQDSLDHGQVHAHLQVNHADLSKLHTVQNLRPTTGGIVEATADITGQLDGSFQPTNVTADASAQALRVNGQDCGAANVSARTNGQTVIYNLTSNFAGSQIHLNGNTALAAGHRTTADANVSGLPIERVLAVLQSNDLPAKGTLTATAHVSGTLDQPQGTLDLSIDRAIYDGQPVDHVHTRVNYQSTSIDVPQLEVRAGSSSLDASAHYDHKPGVLTQGEAQMQITNGHVDLARLHYAQAARPGIAGILQVNANATATVGGSGGAIRPHNVTLDFSGKGVALQGKTLGDLTLAANTSGNRVNFTLASNLAGASMQGKGDAQLGGDYPLTAQVTFHNVNWKNLQPLLGSSPGDFDAGADGEVTVNGPVLRAAAMSGRLQLTRVQFTAVTPGGRAQTTTVENQGPVTIALDHGVARIESLHLTGPQTDVQAQGAASLTAQTLQGTLNAHTDLSLLQRFDREVLASGAITANATVRGTFSSPQINGKLQLQKASLHLSDVTTGLSNANGEVDFNGTSASFQNLTGEAGGGKVVLSGFIAYSGATRMALRLNGTKVRIRPQEGVSAVANVDLHLSGRLESSVVSGTAMINQITYSPKSDLGSILSRAAPAVQSPSTPSAVLDNMKLDIQVRTSSGTRVVAAVAQTLEMDANLHIQGTASQPGVTGQIDISEGKLVFLSSTYTVTRGRIMFYNPSRIDPILDLRLETEAQGVDVTLRVTGPIDNMKLSYTSNPPIQFQEIIGLLAAGQTPTSDPNILANQPTPPAQGFAQLGESAVVGQALADPVANQLQRVFGLSQFKIDPTFANGQDLPQAQLSLQQQVTSRITLTYSTPIQGGGQEAISGQYLMSREWSATATRDQFGLFSIKLLYKRQFK
jgi:translocation and assembly module TamB